MQRDIVEAILVGSLSGHGYLFDGVGVIVTPAGTHQRNLRRGGFSCLDEKILAHANGLARSNAGDVVDAVLIHLDGAVIDVILTASELDLLSVIELDLAALKRAVSRDIELGLRANDGAQVAAALLYFGRHAGPGGEMGSDANLLHRGQIADGNVEMLRRHRASGDIILDVLG